MPHFFVPPRNRKGGKFAFDPSESRHIARALRKGPGDIVRIFDGRGGVDVARLTDVSDPSRVEGEILDAAPREAKASGLRALDVYPALIKGERFEWMLEKLTEIGARSIRPVLSERTIVKVAARDEASKLRRWNGVVLAGAKQSGRAALPEVLPPRPFSQAVRAPPDGALNVFLWEGEEEVFLSSLMDAPADRPVRLLVGPEGGWTLGEVELARKAGWAPALLGGGILRAETAALCAAAVILCRHG